VFYSFKAKHPKKTIKILNGNLTDSNWKELELTMAEYIFILEEHQLLRRDTIHSWIKFFALNPKITAVTAGLQTRPNYTLTNLYQQFELSLLDLWQKFKSTAMLNPRGNPSMYKVSALKTRNRNRVYASPVKLVVNPAVPYFYLHRKYGAKSMYQIIAAVLSSLLVAYFTYVAVVSGYMTLVTIVWIYGFLLFSLAVLLDNTIRTGKKIRMIALAPAVSLFCWLFVCAKVFRGSTNSS
jgi:hypothetical protein